MTDPTTTTDHRDQADRADERRSAAAARARSRRALQATLALPCGPHAAPGGVACWAIERQDRAPSMGACGDRIRRAGFDGAISPDPQRPRGSQ